MTGQREEYVLVPRNPTLEMLKAARDEAEAESATGVWREMLAAFENSQLEKRKIG